MAVAVPAASSVLPSFDWHHEGSPDLTDVAVVAALPVDLKVRLSDIQHQGDSVLAVVEDSWEQSLRSTERNSARSGGPGFVVHGWRISHRLAEGQKQCASVIPQPGARR